ncbi:hypothetical protein PseBG33_2455 [Pseudomonas synxantha BG33R]|nr:hypothetical protein PseBG33_2455 [Pseudomonas synxantha BG33R]
MWKGRCDDSTSPGGDLTAEQIADEKKTADQAGLGAPANSAGLYVGAQQTLGTTFGQATFLQAVSTTFGQATFLQAVSTTFGQATFLQAVSTTFGQATFLQAIRATFGDTSFHQAVGTAFGDYRVGKRVCSEYRESEAKQDLAFHDGVLRVLWLGAVWHGFDVTRCMF